MLVLALAIVFLASEETACVRFQYLGVPGSALLGEDVWLDCGYDLEDDELYSVKWYKDNYEFYRYLPSDQPPSQQYNVDGVSIELQESNASHVHLTATDLRTEGTYACEVSTDGPSFRTVRAEKELRIYVMPDADPLIVGASNHYAVGDDVNVTCFFGPSKPPADLLWYINGEVAPESDVSWDMSHVGDAPDIASVESRLQFAVQREHVLHGAINLECAATVSQIASKGSKEVLVGDTTSAAEFQKQTQVSPGEEAPTITGVRPAYEAGELVEANCTSAAAVERAELQWELNGELVDASFLRPLRPLIHPDGRVSTQLGLRFHLEEGHFRADEMRLRCTAILYLNIEKSAVLTVYSGDPGSSGMFHVLGNSCSGHYLFHCGYQPYIILFALVRAFFTSS